MEVSGLVLNVSTVVDFVYSDISELQIVFYSFRIGCSDFRPRCLTISAYTFYRAGFSVFNSDVFAGV